MNYADENRGKGGNQKAVEAVHQSAMAGNQTAFGLGAEMTLDRGLQQVTGLRQDRQNTRHYANDPQLADPTRISDRDADGNPPDQTADGAGPSLFRAGSGPKQRPAESAAAEEGDYIRGPDNCEQEDERHEAPLRIAAQRRRSDHQG